MMFSENVYHISDIIDKKSYMLFLDNKKERKVITDCQFELIKNSFIHKYNRNNKYPTSTDHLLLNYIKLCKLEKNHEYLIRIQILLNYYYTFDESNEIIKQILNSKNISDKLILYNFNKKSIITEKKNCIIDENVIFYLYKSYKGYLDKIKEQNKKKILYITYKKELINDSYIKDIKYYFKKYLLKMDIYDISEKNKFNMNENENEYDIIFLDHSIINIHNLKELFHYLSFISKENSVLYIFGYDIFTEKDQYIKLLMDKINNHEKDHLEMSYPLNLFEIEFILSQYNFILYYSNNFSKTYSSIPSFIQDYIGLFINRKI